MVQATDTADTAAEYPALRLLHAELYSSQRTGEPILVGCTCSIGRTHTYEEWVAYIDATDPWPTRGAAPNGPVNLVEIGINPTAQER